MHSIDLYQINQWLHANSTKQCTSNMNVNDFCQDTSVIPQIKTKGGNAKNVVKLPGGYQLTSDGVTTVIVDMVIQRIEAIDLKSNKIKINGFPRFWWVDKRLAWNNVTFPILETHYKSKLIWVPDVIPVLTTGSTLIQTWARWTDYVWVRHDGLCRWAPKGSFEYITNFDLSLDSKAEQTVSLVWESWMYTGQQLQLNVRNSQFISISKFNNANIKNSNQELVSNSAKLATCDEYISGFCFPSLNFDIKFRRKSTNVFKKQLDLSNYSMSDRVIIGLLSVIFVLILFQVVVYLVVTCCYLRKIKVNDNLLR